MTQGERVREIRKELGLTLEKFGEKIGLKKNSVSQIENKKNELTEANAKAICREFNVNEHWLYTGEGEMFRKPSDEIGYYVEDLLEYEGHGNAFYDLIIEMMKKYQELDEKSKTVMRNYFDSVIRAIREES